jgi:hypothetical protein
MLLSELAEDRAMLRARERRIADLEAQLEAHRQQLARVVRRALARNRALQTRKPRPPRPAARKRPARIRPRRRSKSKRPYQASMGADALARSWPECSAAPITRIRARYRICPTASRAPRDARRAGSALNIPPVG